MDSTISSTNFWRHASLTAPDLPETLYHYTTREGLYGILSSSKIWASSSQFLNDASEFTYSTQLIAEIATDLKKTSTNWFEQQLLSHAVALHTSDSLKKDVFVFSLSENGDLLSQWRAYGKSGNAYAMGFSPSVLVKTLADQRILFSPCLYERDKQVLKIRELLNVALREFHSHGFQPDDAQTQSWPPGLAQAIADVNLAFIQAAALIKHPAFVDEREWRLVRIGQQDGVSGALKFRPASSHLVPYVEWSVASGFMSQRLLKEIVIGPSPQFAIDAASIEHFLNRRVTTGIVVRPSTIPFRSQ